MIFLYKTVKSVAVMAIVDLGGGTRRALSAVLRAQAPAFLPIVNRPCCQGHPLRFSSLLRALSEDSGWTSSVSGCASAISRPASAILGCSLWMVVSVVVGVGLVLVASAPLLIIEDKSVGQPGQAALIVMRLTARADADTPMLTLLAEMARAVACWHAFCIRISVN